MAKSDNLVHIIFNGNDVFAWTADEALAIAICKTYRANRSMCERSHVTARECTWAEVR